MVEQAPRNIIPESIKIHTARVYCFVDLKIPFELNCYNLQTTKIF